MPGTVYAVAGSKGGVGKTTTAANLAATLRATGREVVLVDADLAMSNLQDLIGIAQEPTLHDVLGGDAALEEAILRESDGVLDAPGRIDILPGATTLDAFASADPESLTDVVDELAREYDTVILDTASGITRETAVPIEAADSTIVTTTPARPSVLDASKTVEFVESLDGTVEGLVISRFCPGLDDETILEEVGIDHLVTIPDLDAPGVTPLEPYRRLVVRLLIGKDIATDPAEVLEIDEGDTPRITEALEPVPETAEPSDPARVPRAPIHRTDDGPRTASADDDHDDDPDPGSKDGTIDRFVDAIGRPSD
jgi:septum site-determining protein MinD